MIAVIFEVELVKGQRDTYLDIAAALKPVLEEIDGFISVERFQSVIQSNKLVSLSFFENEAAIAQWRTTAEHRLAQRNGRVGIFENYRLRVAEVCRDYGLNRREEAPEDSVSHHR